MQIQEKLLVKVNGKIRLPGGALSHLMGIANRSIDGEQCGFIMRDGEIIEADNTHSSPRSSFEIDPALHLQLLKSRRRDILGIYHTHPSGNPNASDSDNQGYPDNMKWRYFILTRTSITEWERLTVDAPSRL